MTRTRLPATIGFGMVCGVIDDPLLAEGTTPVTYDFDPTDAARIDTLFITAPTTTGGSPK